MGELAVLTEDAHLDKASTVVKGKNLAARGLAVAAVADDDALAIRRLAHVRVRHARAPGIRDCVFTEPPLVVVGVRARLDHVTAGTLDDALNAAVGVVVGERIPLFDRTGLVEKDPLEPVSSFVEAKRLHRKTLGLYQAPEVSAQGDAVVAYGTHRSRQIVGLASADVLRRHRV